ncbi:MAG: YaiI/YqxD family protein [Micavibrio sp.]|nr:MAG: YaiI/YqxD family protein [Micavibrio sp.]
MKIWVDADACPKVIKEILFRAADRTKTPVVFVANQWLQLPASAFIDFILVEQGSDIADDKIAEGCEPGDLVITADIPLAARAVEKGAAALDPRGTMYGKHNIKQILSMRDFMDSLRGSGVDTGGPDSFGQRERLAFANELDRFITKAQQ